MHCFSKERYNSTYIHNFSAPENGWLNYQTLVHSRKTDNYKYVYTALGNAAHRDLR